MDEIKGVTFGNPEGAFVLEAGDVDLAGFIQYRIVARLANTKDAIQFIKQHGKVDNPYTVVRGIRNIVKREITKVVLDGAE